MHTLFSPWLTASPPPPERHQTDGAGHLTPTTGELPPCSACASYAPGHMLGRVDATMPWLSPA